MTSVGLAEDDGEDSSSLRPILFAAKDNGVVVKAPELEWKLTDDGRIDFAGAVWNSTEIQIYFSQTLRAQTDSHYRTSGHSDKDLYASHISFQWLAGTISEGKIELVTSDGKTLLTKSFFEKDLESYKADVESADDVSFSAHIKSQFGIFDFDPNVLRQLAKTDFQYCVRQVKSAVEKMRICSGMYRFRFLNSGAAKLESVMVPPSGTAIDALQGVFLNPSENLGASGRFAFNKDRATRFKVQFKNGASVQVITRPGDLDVQDVIANSKRTRIRVISHGYRPVGPMKYLVVPPNHFWSPTGLDEMRLWRVEIPYANPKVRVLAEWDLPIAFPLEFSQLPSFSDRVYLQRPPDSSSYADFPVRRGNVKRGYQIASTENRIVSDGEGEFEWKLNNKRRGERNLSRFTLQRPVAGGSSAPGAPSSVVPVKFVGNYNMFRAYPNEVSARLTGLLSESLQFIGLLEFAGSHWFESLGGDDYFLSYQRWGVSARYYRSINPIQVPTGDSKAPVLSLSPFAAFNVDLKYNLFAGTWNRDELLGLLLSVQNLEVGKHKSLNVGYGAYWARTMPKFIDDLFNLLWFFRYPKYVDTEFGYYPLSLTSGIELGPSYQLNFHGKVFWSKRVFGEAGFGLKAYSLRDANTSVKPSQPDTVSFSTFYGTVGMGMVF